ncbi:182 kDa tankyrase-1-binding protein [Echinops telfairi]|uniref:182 kDa tankyrase-1-binding protein n=2 Tax=Echinops telfairi TaxID=9371 RepID=A0AC55DMI4_ECHTE|nr:182 kDa tankyrase-1-binding protein [Echinops telfairi]XP_045152959.1 182 kDa tankyrase-1-binding protein [Echinops telfairi]
MKVSPLREGTAMASPPPRELEEELVPAGSEPGDPRAKPPVKPKPRALPTKPALPAKPTLLVPVGPRPPRGPLAELPSARKMNMLAGPQPYGGSKRPLPFAPRPAAETPDGGEAARDNGKDEAGKEEVPPLTPPARCAPLGGVRKAPAPFRPASERFAATTVEEILAKMEQTRKEVPASPDRLWGSRLTFNHDGSSRYGPRTYGMAPNPREEDGVTLSRAWPQDGLEKSPAESQDKHSKTPKERSPVSDVAFNGDLPQPASSEPPASVSKPQDPSELALASDNGVCAVSPGDVASSVPGPPCPGSPEDSPPHPALLPGAQSPEAPRASPLPPVTPESPRPALLDEGSCHPPDPGLPAEGAPEVPRPCSLTLERDLGCQSPEQPPASSPRRLIEGDEFPNLKQTFLSEEAVVAEGPLDFRPASLAQRRFSEGVLRPPSPDRERLGGSLAALPPAQENQVALGRSFGSDTESNWSLSQSFEWTFPTRPSGLGTCRLDSPPPSPITEATEAAEAAAEAGYSSVSICKAAVSEQEQGVRAVPEGLGQPSSQLQEGDPGISPTQKGDPQPLPTAGGLPGPPTLLQAQERYEEREPLAGQESPLPLATREVALPILEPILGQQQPAPPDQPCILFADAPNAAGRVSPSEEEAVTLAQAETTQPRMEAQAPCRASPEPVGPGNSSRWLDDLLASPPPSTGSARRGAGSEPKDAQTPGSCSEGLLGWAQKDLQSEFGIAADSQPTRFSSSSWSQDASQDYSLGGVSRRGDPGLGESDWASKYGQGVGEGSSSKWASRCGIGPEPEAGSGTGREDAAGGRLVAHDPVIGKPNLLGAAQSPEAIPQDWEFQKRDSRGTYSSRDAELQDQEFGKRDSLGAYTGRDAGLGDWDFGKRDSLGAYTSRDAHDKQDPELGTKDPLGPYSNPDVDQHGPGFEEREAALGALGGVRDVEAQGLALEPGAWMSGYSSGGSAALLASQDRGFSAGFSLQDAQQQDEEFEKKVLSGGDSRSRTSSDAGHLEAGEPEVLFSASSPQPQDRVLGPREPDGNTATPEVSGLQGRQQVGAQSPGDPDLEEREQGTRGWATEFSLGVVPAQPTAVAFSAGSPDWSDSYCSERSPQFGIIGNDRAGSAGLSPSDQVGGGPFVPPGKTTAMDWTDQLGLRNLDVSSCLGADGPSETREAAAGQMGWSDNLGLRDVDLSSLETRGSEDLRAIRVREENWTSDVRVEEAGGHCQARESGVGQTDWSGMEAGEFLKSREHGVGQADWTPDLGLRNMASGAGCSPGEPRELGVGQMDWANNLGLRNLEVPCDEAGESPEPRGCGVGQMDWAQDLGLRDTEFSGGLPLAREHGVGEVNQCPELDHRSNRGLSPDLEARDLSEARELGVGETSVPDTLAEDESWPSSETHPADPRMETADDDVAGCGARCSPHSFPARSPPSGSQDLLEEMLAAHSAKIVAHRDSGTSGPGYLSQEGATLAAADQGEPLEPGMDPLPSWRPQPDGEASRTEEVDGGWNPPGAGRGEQGPARTPRRPPPCPTPSSPSQDFSFIEDTEVLDSAMYRSRANLGRKRGHRAPAIRPGGTLGLSDAADSDTRLFQDSTEPRASRLPSSDEEVVEEPQSRRTKMSLGSKGLKVNLFPALSPSALKAKLRPRNRSAEEGEPVESKSTQKESAVQRSKSCKVPGLGKPLSLPPKPEKSSGSEGSSPSWLQALKLKKKKV